MNWQGLWAAADSCWSALRGPLPLPSQLSAGGMSSALHSAYKESLGRRSAGEMSSALHSTPCSPRQPAARVRGPYPAAGSKGRVRAAAPQLRAPAGAVLKPALHSVRLPRMHMPVPPPLLLRTLCLSRRLLRL